MLNSPRHIHNNRSDWLSNSQRMKRLHCGWFSMSNLAATIVPCWRRIQHPFHGNVVRSSAHGIVERHCASFSRPMHKYIIETVSCLEFVKIVLMRLVRAYTSLHWAPMHWPIITWFDTEPKWNHILFQQVIGRYKNVAQRSYSLWMGIGLRENEILKRKKLGISKHTISIELIWTHCQHIRLFVRLFEPICSAIIQMKCKPNVCACTIHKKAREYNAISMEALWMLFAVGQ